MDLVGRVSKHKNTMSGQSSNFFAAKSTLSRLHESPAEKTERIAKLSSAVRTLLECIGEDPEREGLQRTPERYAKALLWMTKGYEERLSGM